MDKNYVSGHTLFFGNEGPMIRYWPRDCMFQICDLNPETELRWQMTRWELFRFGWRCMRRAVLK